MTETWAELLIERRSAPAPLVDDDFRRWADGRAIFISSAIDEEMEPLRRAAKELVVEIGGMPIMWEAITPRDQRAEEAFLEGVDRSSLFVLLVGSRYGVTDDSGYSATHKETIRAGELATPRLLFELNAPAATRDGRLNDWIRSIYSEVSGAKVTSAEHLTALLDQRVRELAAGQERTWIKLGALLFPGSVRRTTDRTGVAVTITAQIADPALRRGLSELAASPHRAGSVLTYRDTSEPIAVNSIAVESAVASRVEVTIECRSDQGYGSFGRALGLGTVVTGGRSYGAAEQVTLWSRTSLLGERTSSMPDFIRSIWGGDDDETLPDILRHHSATGWIAEGIVRTYLVEGIIGRFGGYFDRLEVGPATTSGVRVRFDHVTGGKDVARFEGIVPTTA